MKNTQVKTTKKPVKYSPKTTGTKPSNSDKIKDMMSKGLAKLSYKAKNK